MKTKLFLAVVLIFITGMPAFSQDIEELPPEPVIKITVDELDVPEGKEVILSVYTVKKGDWLAKIAEKEYENQDLWNIIYSYNKYIKNSHWIFPGNKLIVPVIVDKLPKVPEVAPKKALKKVEKLRDYGNFIAPEEFEFSGTIAGFKKQKAMHAQGDYLFIDMGKEHGITENQRLYIYRMSRYIAHPYTGELLGNLVEKIGEIQVMGDIEKKSATARIIYSDRSIETGDMLLIKN